ncbi:MAG: hypothetical protein N2515_10075 [Deltaproteobacteria bacterium]|nr:hypothetical protein [Deltaproteobacteria bacterium]
MWYIDPIDGTTNFAHGLPLFCISLGLVERDGSKEQPLLGVVYAPAMDCLYFGGAGLGAYCETKGSRKRLEVSSVSTIERALLASGFPSAELRRKMALGEKEPWAASQKERLWRLDAIGHGVRRLGVAALEICWVAEGRFDAFWDFGLRPWDVAGATAILNEAGGKATDVDGGELDLHRARYLASNGKLHSALVEAMREGLDEGVPLLSKEA